MAADRTREECCEKVTLLQETAMVRDVIRKENVKRYVHVPVKPKNSASNFVSQNLPMAAMFLKNKALSWACLFIAVQTYLNEPYIKDPSDDSSSGIFKILFASVALGTSYLDLVFPTMGGFMGPNAAGTATEAATEAVAAAAATASA